MACSHSPLRDPAALTEEQATFFGQVDRSKSSVRLFRPEMEDKIFRYYFYLQLKDMDGKWVDVDKSEIAIKTTEGKKLDFQLKRQGVTGRYYVIVERPGELQFSKLNFYIQGHKILERFNLFMPVPDSSKSRLEIVDHNYEKRIIHFRLTLNDSQGRPVEDAGYPEIIMKTESIGNPSYGPIEGLVIEDYELIKKGVWEFYLLYTEQNQIIYFTVRSQGTYLNNLFRLHHVDKAPY